MIEHLKIMSISTLIHHLTFACAIHRLLSHIWQIEWGFKIWLEYFFFFFLVLGFSFSSWLFLFSFCVLIKMLRVLVGTVSFFFADVDPDLFFCTDVLCLCCVVGSEPLISQCVSRRVSLHFKRSCCERLYYHSSLWAQQHDSCSVNLWPAQIALWIASSRPLSPPSLHPSIFFITLFSTFSCFLFFSWANGANEHSIL